MKRLGEKLKQARENKKYTQVEVANLIGISNGTLSGYERNYRDPDTDTLKKLANLYGVTIDFLMGQTIKTDQSDIENDSDKTIKLLEEEAFKMGLTPSDPKFLKMISDALDMLRIARGQDHK